MANYRLTDEERERLAPILDDLRARLLELADGSEGLLWAFRRRVFTQLQYDERGKPQVRRALKAKKRIEQNGVCNVCRKSLPATHVVLDRHEGMLGYTQENTQLLCQACDTKKQVDKAYT